jgi:hypothetical protein
VIVTPLRSTVRTVAARIARPTGIGVLIATLLSLTACSGSHTGQAGVALDPAGRLVVVLALCDNQLLRSLTLTDESTGTTVTAHPSQTPPVGGTVILTGPITNPRPEGVFDLLDPGHDYTLTGSTKKTGSNDESGTLSPVRFKLDNVVKEPKLRQDSVLAPGEDDDSMAVTPKAAFVARARDAC